MEIMRNSNEITLVLSKKQAKFVEELLSAEEAHIKQTLQHLNREVSEGELCCEEETWRSGGCKVNTKYAANLMYDSFERLAAIKDLSNQIEAETQKN